MKIDQENFAQLVNKAMQVENVSHMRSVIEKELLHYDILFALEKGGLLDKLTFQGGTSLRLCYGGNRFSEDLDFAGGNDFSSAMLADMKHCIEKYIGERYGLEVTVKEPKDLKQDPKYSELSIDKWQIAVVTSPERKDLPKQKIKVEVANIPAYTREPQPLQINYDFLPDGYSDTLILTESLDEVTISTANTIRSEKSPLSLRVINATEIYRSPGGNRDISKVLQILPGVATTASFRNDIFIGSRLYFEA